MSFSLNEKKRERMSDALTPKVRSVENMVKRARAITRSTPASAACPTCHITIFVSVFFDGTGNNKDKDFPVCHSNVAALFDAHRVDEERGIAKLYYEGLGTAFEFKDRYEEVAVGQSRTGVVTAKFAGYKEDGESMMGKGFAVGIQERLEKAVFDFCAEIERWRNIRRLDAVNLAVFGFSRGSTAARAFLHWLAAHSKIKVSGRKLTYDDIPINVKFLGIFDTVESVGAAGENKDAGVIKTSIPSFVENCSHFIAAHELRHAFPVTLSNNPNHRQVVYPGAHADIGGGYKPNEQGRSNQLARMALLNMLDEARATGLKMMSLGEMKADDDWADVYSHSFQVPKEVMDSLAAYQAIVKPAGSVQQHFEAHMKHYQAWIDSGKAIADVRHKRGDQTKPEFRRKDLETMEGLLSKLARTDDGKGVFGAKKVSITEFTPADHFIAKYVHDSFEHFGIGGGALQTDMSMANYYQLRTIKMPLS